MSHVEANTLIDFYGSLLTSRQLEILTYYYQEDYSISEIAELLGISRAAVQKILKTASLQLEQYEGKLKMAALYRSLQAFAAKLDPQTAAQLENLLESVKIPDKP